MTTPKAFTLEWNGDALAEAMAAAARGAVDAVLEQTTRDASANAPRRSGDLANGFARAPAVQKGNEIVGIWGNRQWYFWIVEARHPSQAGFARRATDVNYPKLSDEIKRRLPK